VSQFQIWCLRTKGNATLGCPGRNCRMMLWLLHLPHQFPPHPIEKRSQPPAELALVRTLGKPCNSETFDESHTLGSAIAAAPSRIPSPWLLLPDTSHTRSAPRLVHTRQSTPSGAHNTQSRATKAPRRPARHNRRRNGSAAAATATATAVASLGAQAGFGRAQL
jgi:hypothetical protein